MNLIQLRVLHRGIHITLSIMPEYGWVDQTEVVLPQFAALPFRITAIDERTSISHDDGPSNPPEKLMKRLQLGERPADCPTALLIAIQMWTKGYQLIQNYSLYLWEMYILMTQSRFPIIFFVFTMTMRKVYKETHQSHRRSECRPASQHKAFLSRTS